MFAGPKCLKVCDLGTVNDVVHVREDGLQEVDPEQTADQGTTTIWTVDNKDHVWFNTLKNFTHFSGYENGKAKGIKGTIQLKVR